MPQSTYKTFTASIYIWIRFSTDILSTDIFYFDCNKWFLYSGLLLIFHKPKVSDHFTLNTNDDNIMTHMYYCDFQLQKELLVLFNSIPQRELYLLFLTYFSWFDLIYINTSRCKPVYNHHYLSLHLLLEGGEYIACELRLAHNTQWRKYFYITGSVIVLINRRWCYNY